MNFRGKQVQDVLREMIIWLTVLGIIVPDMVANASKSLYVQVCVYALLDICFLDHNILSTFRACSFDYPAGALTIKILSRTYDKSAD